MVTAKDLKKQENIRQHAARLADLQLRQKRAASLRRAHGYVGNDQSVIRQHTLAVIAQREAAQREREEEQRESEAKFLDGVVTGGYGRHFRVWLKGREATFALAAQFLRENPELRKAA